MSEENLELMRKAVDAWNRADLEEWASYLSDDVVWVPLAENAQNQPVRGKGPTLDFVRDWIEPWKAYTIEIHRLVDAGDAIVMMTTQTGTDESGTEVTIEMHAAGFMRDGKLAEMRWFLSEADALRAAGVSG